MIGSRLSKDTTNKSFGAEDWARPSKDLLPDIEGSLNSNESVGNYDLNPTGPGLPGGPMVWFLLCDSEYTTICILKA